MSSHISPEAIQAHFCGCCSRSGDLKNPAGDCECGVRCHNFYACDPLCYFSSLSGSNIPLLSVEKVDVADLLPSNVSEGFYGSEVCQVRAILPKNIVFVGTSGNRLWGVRPGASVLGGVVGAEFESTEGDAKVEI